MLKEIFVENVKCDGCASRISDEIGKLEGVNVLSVSIAQGMVRVNISEEEKLKTVKDQLHALGYPLKKEANLLAKAKSYFTAFGNRNK